MTIEDADAERRRIEVADVRRMMNKREGRRFMWRLLSISEPFKVPGPESVEVTNFENGRRVIGTTLLAEISNACPEQYALMQEEARQDALTLAQIRDRPSRDRHDNDRSRDND